MISAIPVARLFGFEIRVHVSWLVILAIIAVSVVTRIDEVAPKTDTVVRWVVGGIVAAAFLLSALAHELGHAIAARRAGMPGGPIVVYFFGGAASIGLDARRPRDEIVSALAGPLVSLTIGLAFLALAAVGLAIGRGAALDMGRIALIIGGLNLVLGGVNLLPAFPLDGGRVVRGLAWARTGDPAAGLRVAARSGRVLGILLAAAGILLILVVDSIDGLMLALGGWFVVSSAQAVERNAEVDAVLAGIHVVDVMDRDVTGLPPGLTLDTFAEQLLADGSTTSIPVTREGDLLGMVGARQVRAVRRDRWAATRAEDLMVTGDALPEVAPDTTLLVALDQLRRSGLDGLPVFDAGVMAGIV
ncbi:MAG: site-2 protease family protein, partial [Candidatus Limnocylindrales bacterium]